ncbi:acyl-CoA thioesterase [Ureibacillus chungkukjangi]|uniref:Acyl-CoA hydrolase n=1 Tax=Ureibacillus chungkukjangi TaxID=1202712 RepID=A0A318TT61_9BACL|nr:acyl-CoA thioesterase [Ureibacillus chungkukjangi]MCM3387654.1 acyl-CoA thioesterase [Ureibacillus chungkukjangi]PYF07972.1 acyl-CoA hydrolase [Ureibacillus chungkukjangi]
MTNEVPISYSRSFQTHLILPPDTNHHNSIFGGKVLAYIDEIAAITSMKHAKSEVVTASFDSVDFISPAYVGNILELEAMVTSTGRSSMEVYVRVMARNLKTGELRLTTESFVTMVAVDESGRPVQVPKVYPETERERQLFETGSTRRELRQAKRLNTKERRRLLENLE